MPSAQSSLHSAQRNPRTASAQHRSRKPIRRQSLLAPFTLRAVMVGCGALVCTVFITVLPALGLRLEHQDLTPAEPSQAEQARQDLALQAKRIAASRSLAPDNAALFDAADSWVSQLGGVWVAWPDGAPEGYENAAIDTSGYSNIDELREALWAFSGDVYAFDSSELLGEKAADSDVSSSTDFGVLLALEAISHAIALDSTASTQAQCSTLEHNDIETLGISVKNAPQAIEKLSLAQQYLDYQAAVSNSGKTLPENQAHYETLSGYFQSILDAALRAGAEDSRFVMAPPPIDDASIDQAIDTALTSLAAANIQSREGLETVRLFNCTIVTH